MNEELPLPPGQDKFRPDKFFQYLLQGLLVIAPITITIYTIYWIVTSIDNLIPIFTEQAPNGNVYVRNYGLGFLIILIVVCIIGYFSSFFIKLKLFGLFDHFMERTPGVRFIYTTVKDFFEAFAGEKKKFNQPVVANIDDKDVWRVGFLTRSDMKEFGLKDYVAVYIPMSYSIAGTVYIVPKDRIKAIANIGATEVMKFAISGGVANVEEEKHRPPIY